MTYFTRTRPAVWSGQRLLPTIYVIIGVLVASSHNYFVNVDSVKTIFSAILAVILWPLLLLGINMHVH